VLIVDSSDSSDSSDSADSTDSLEIPIFASASERPVANNVSFQSSGLQERPKNLTCNAHPRPNNTQKYVFDSVLSKPSKRVDMRQIGLSDFFLVAENKGVIKRYERKFDQNEYFADEQEFLNIEDRVETEFNGTSWAEMGLLAVAIHPEFQDNGYLYVYYSALGSEDGSSYEGRLSRFTSSDYGTTASSESELVLLKIDHSEKGEHWGGGLQFGNDGNLYLSVGDGSEQEKVQDLSYFNGKVLRIDVDSQEPYTIPLDNPYLNRNSLEEIYAVGFRNPWRLSIDNDSGRVLVGDVGQATWEEVNEVAAGANYGWPYFEGTKCNHEEECNNSDFIAPLEAYKHQDIPAAIIGGYVYRGDTLPELYGKYIYSDVVSGDIFALDINTIDGISTKIANAENVFSYTLDSEGEIYAVSRDGILKLSLNKAIDTVEFPQLLSETGCVRLNDPTQPDEGMIFYNVISPLWSDGALKDRWFALPEGIPTSKIEIEEGGNWKLPIGSVVMKNFSINSTLIETRLLMRHDDGGWGGYSYQWRSDQSDAELLEDRKELEIGDITWTYPSREDCFLCHTDSVGITMGLETLQLNRAVNYPGEKGESNQLDTLSSIGVLDDSIVSGDAEKLVNPHDLSAPLTSRAHSYFHANCSGCHSPGGFVPGNLDFRFNPSFNVFESVISPGKPEESILLDRLKGKDNLRMPPLATNVVDDDAISLVKEWILSLAETDSLDIRNGEYLAFEFPRTQNQKIPQSIVTLRGIASTEIDSLRIIIFDAENQEYFGRVGVPSSEQWFFSLAELHHNVDSVDWSLTTELMSGRYRLNAHAIVDNQSVELKSIEFIVE